MKQQKSAPRKWKIMAKFFDRNNKKHFTTNAMKQQQQRTNKWRIRIRIRESTAWRRKMGTDKPKATTITMENNQKQITDEENDFVICFENGVVGIC